MFTKKILFLLFIPSIIIVNVHSHPDALVRKWLSQEDIRPSNEVSAAPPAIAQPLDQNIQIANSSDTAPALTTTQSTSDQIAPPEPNGTVSNSPSSQSNPIAVAAAPQVNRNATTVCQKSGKSIIFVNQDCLDAARMIAQNGLSFYQCGNCVLGLYDADQKKPFKPSGPFNTTILQDQTTALLAQCTKGSTNQALKRDNSASNQTTTNVQLLMGYNGTAKACPSQ